jgi:type IV pilus assembly protein PilN
MRFTLNLATRTYINTRQVNLLLGCAGFCLVGALVGFSSLVMVNRAQQQKLETDLAGVDARIKATAKGVSDREYQALLGKIKVANGIIQRKSFNWLGFLSWLEAVVPDGVMVVSLEPSLKEGKLTINGVARNFQLMRKFIENLEDSKFFTDIYLLNQAEAKVDETQKGVSFSVSCKADVTKL